MITYNYLLFQQLLVILFLFNGITWAYCSVVHNGETREWKWYGLFDGLLMVAIAIVPVFF
jgi:hypothetical protein